MNYRPIRPDADYRMIRTKTLATSFGRHRPPIGSKEEYFDFCEASFDRCWAVEKADIGVCISIIL